MKVMCIRIEMDSNLKRYVFAFTRVDEGGDYTMPGEIRITSEKMDAFIIGQTYACSIG